MEKSNLLSCLDTENKRIASELISSQIVAHSFYRKYNTKENSKNVHLYLQLRDELKILNSENLYTTIRTELYINKVAAELNLEDSKFYSLDLDELKIQFGFQPHKTYLPLAK